MKLPQEAIKEGCYLIPSKDMKNLINERVNNG